MSSDRFTRNLWPIDNVANPGNSRLLCYRPSRDRFSKRPIVNDVRGA